MQIREYKTDDKSDVMACFRSNIPQYFLPNESQLLADYLENDLEKFFVIEIEGRIIGAGGVNFEDEGESGVLSWGFIHADFHANGYGRLLVKKRIAYLLENKQINKIIVRTSQLTHLFYRRMGFELKHTETDYWGGGLDLYYMEQSAH